MKFAVVLSRAPTRDIYGSLAFVCTGGYVFGIRGMNRAGGKARGVLNNDRTGNDKEESC